MAFSDIWRKRKQKFSSRDRSLPHDLCEGLSVFCYDLFGFHFTNTARSSKGLERPEDIHALALYECLWIHSQKGSTKTFDV
jgi:hypothetical protein